MVYLLELSKGMWQFRRAILGYYYDVFLEASGQVPRVVGEFQDRVIELVLDDIKVIQESFQREKYYV